MGDSDEIAVRRDVILVNGEGKLQHVSVNPWEVDVERLKVYTFNEGESYTDLEVIPGEGGNPASVKIIGELDDSAAEWKVISCRPSCTATSKNRRARISSEWFVATFDGPAQVPKNFKNGKFGTYASFWGD